MKYWTKERILEAAFKCKSRGEFKKKYSGAYRRAIQDNILDEVVKGLPAKYKPAGYWTKSKITEVASGFKTLRGFREKEPNAYQIACKKGWIEEVTAHMELEHMRAGHWTKERVTKEAKKYKKRTVIG
jgi:hypothetical protein